MEHFRRRGRLVDIIKKLCSDVLTTISSQRPKTAYLAPAKTNALFYFEFKNRFRSLFVPDTQKPSTPLKLNETLTTVIPETPPNMMNLPQSTRLECGSFKLNISDLNLTDTQEDSR